MVDKKHRGRMRVYEDRLYKRRIGVKSMEIHWVCVVRVCVW